MVDYNLIEQIGIQEGEVEGLIREALGEDVATGDMDGLLQDNIQDFKPGAILKGRVVGKAGDDVPQLATDQLPAPAGGDD